MRLTQLDQFHAGSGMADEYGLVDADGVEDCDVVRRPGRNVVAVRRLARGKPSSAGDADDEKVVGELKRELIVHVRVVAAAREQHHRLACTPQSMTSRSTPRVTVTKRIVCGVLSTHAAVLFSVAHAAIGAPNVSSAAALSKDSRSDCVVFIGILPPPAGRPRRFGRDPTDDTDRVDS